MTTGNFENVIHPLQLEQTKDQPQQAEGAVDWVRQNVANPAINAGIVEPYNAATNIAKAVSADNVNCEEPRKIAEHEPQKLSA